MQFFPDTRVSALGGVSLSLGRSKRRTDGGGKFLSSLNAELAASGVTPIVDANRAKSAPTGFRQIKKDHSAALDNEDVEVLLTKFRARGVDDSALTRIEGLLTSGSTLTVGNIRGALREYGRTTGGLTDDEMKSIESALQKMQFSAEDSHEIMGLMVDGHGFEAMQCIKKQATSLGENAFSLSKGEVNALARGLDVSDKGMKKVSALLGKSDAAINADSLEALQRIKKQAAGLGKNAFSQSKREVNARPRGLDISDKGMKKISAPLGKSDAKINADSLEATQRIKKQAASLGGNAFSPSKGEVNAQPRDLDVSDKGMKKISALLGENDAEINADSLEAMLAPATEELSRRKSELEKAEVQFREVMDETLSDKKTRERNALVSDTRGSQQTDRAETRMRDDLTAKGNDLGPKNLEEIEEEEDTLADQHAFDQWERSRKDEANGQRTVDVADSGRDKAHISAEKASSSTRENFSPLLNRMDVSSGVTTPAQSQTAAHAQQNTATTAFAHRQEILNQVEQGMLRQLSDGTRQMTLQLNPGELGHLTVVLSVRSGEVRALIRADNPETTTALSEQMSQLRATLEEQGLKVAQLDVETQLPSDTTQEQWTDMGQFNREQEMREQARFQRLSKLRQDSGENRSAPESQMGHTRQEMAETGLHIIA